MYKHFKGIMATLALIVAGAAAGTAQADIITTTGNGTVSGSVNGYDGWLNEDTFTGGIDFLVFEADPETLFSIDVSSDIDFGLSVYEGLIVNESGIPFSNSGDFFDFNSFLTYVGGTPMFAALGSSISGMLLSTGGWYTVAIGGDDIFGSTGSIDYIATLASASAQAVPAPALPALLVAGFVALGLSRRHSR